MKRSRRAFLRAAALAGAVGAAGCGNGDGTRVTAPPGGGNGGTTATGTTNGTVNGTATGDGPATGTATLEPVGSSETWRTYQNDLANTGSAPLNHTRFLSSERNWTVTLDAEPTTQPAFDEERIYVPTRDSIHAVDRETQEIVWSFEPPEGAVTTPLVPGDKFVYVAAGSGVYQIHARDGWRAFTYEFTSEFSSLLGVNGAAPPILVGNTIVVNLVIKKTSGARTTVTRVLGLDTQGNEKYRRDLPATATALGRAPTPAVAGGQMYLTSGRGKQDATLYGLNPNNGGVGFSTNYTGKGWSSITVRDGQLYFADRYADVFTSGGRKVVRRTLDPPPNAYACAAGSELVFMSSRTYGGNEGQLFAINERGTAEWTFAGEGNLFVPTTTNNSVYVVGASGSLFALDQTEGLVRWEQDLGLSGPIVASAPVVSTDELFLTASDGSGPAKLISVSPTR